MPHGSTKPGWPPGMLIVSILALVLRLAGGATPSSASPPGASCPGDNGGITLLPAEEVVILREGADYGWPQCYNEGQSQKLVLTPDGGKVGLRCRRPRQAANSA
jgi:hypothetical protein